MGWRAAHSLYGKKTFPENKKSCQLSKKATTEQSKLTVHVYFIQSDRLHQCGFRVCYQDKHISIQAEFVDPTVQFCGHVDPWTARGDVDNIRAAEGLKRKRVSKKQGLKIQNAVTEKCSVASSNSISAFLLTRPSGQYTIHNANMTSTWQTCCVILKFAQYYYMVGGHCVATINSTQ